MTQRDTLRGAERPAFEPGARADVLICGASFAGLAVARALAGSGLDVLVLDRYAIGERQTSACAIPEPWVDALGLRPAVRQRLEHMAFHTPHGSHRFRLPWAWAAFDYRQLCTLMWEHADARFDYAVVTSRAAAPQAAPTRATDPPPPAGGVAERETDLLVETDRGPIRATYVIDALGWKRVLGAPLQPPDAPLSRGLEVHPPVRRPPAHPHHNPHAVDLDVWIDRSLVRYGYAWNVPARDEQRVGAGSYEPRHHVKRPTVEAARRLGLAPEGYQGNWFPHRLRPAVGNGVMFAGDSAGHCLPLSGEGIRTALHFGAAAGRAIREQPTRAAALDAYAAFSRGHRRAFRLAFALQWLIPRLPPRVLDAALDVLGRPRLARPAFAWYLRIAAPPYRDGDPWTTSASTSTASPPASSRTGAAARS